MTEKNTRYQEKSSPNEKVIPPRPKPKKITTGIIIRSDQEKSELISEYTNLTNSTASSYTESSRQLRNALIAACAAFMAIIIATMSNQDLMNSHSSLFSRVIQIGMTSYTFSILSGIIAYMHEILMFWNMHNVYNSTTEKIPSSSNLEIEELQNNAIKEYNKYAKSKIERVLIVLQVLSFAIGTIMSLVIFFYLLNN